MGGGWISLMRAIIGLGVGLLEKTLDLVMGSSEWWKGEQRFRMRWMRREKEGWDVGDGRCGLGLRTVSLVCLCWDDGVLRWTLRLRLRHWRFYCSYFTTSGREAISIGQTEPSFCLRSDIQRRRECRVPFVAYFSSSSGHLFWAG